jgi:uncharacterized protein involved in exopolysaccharide biosynthesis
MNYILTSPSLDDLIRLLKAWHFWVLGAIFGALIGAAVYYVAPPPYRARATVNVDFNLRASLVSRKLTVSSSITSNANRASLKRSPGLMRS